MMDGYTPLPQPNFEIHDTRPYDDPADDVRLAAHQCAQSGDDTREAFGRLAAVAREEGMEPAVLARDLDTIDAASWQNANVAVQLVDGFRAKPQYVKSPDPEEHDPWRAAVKEALTRTVSPADYAKAQPHLQNLAHRNGSTKEAIDNMLHLRQQAMAGGDAYQQARQTAFSHYRSWNGVNPKVADASRDVAQATKVFPDITADPAFKAAVANELQHGEFPLEMTGVEVAAEARRRVLERQYNG